MTSVGRTEGGQLESKERWGKSWTGDLEEKERDG